MDTDVNAGERISRFARHSSQYSVVAKRVRHSAFMPPRSFRLSVFRTSDMENQEIWALADDVVSSNPPIKARADVASDHVLGVGLQIESEPGPHPRHADIIGWPEEKAEQMDAAKELAIQATLVLR